MISKKITLNVDNNRSNQNKPIIFYRGDHGILLRVKLTNFKFDIDRINNIKASVYNPDRNIKYTLLDLEREDDVITVPVASSINGWTSLNELGNYYVYLHLFDDYDNRITVPNFVVECKEVIG